MIRRSILEWQKIGYGADNATIPDAAAARLVAVAKASVFSGRGGEGVLEHGRHALRARGIVGVIAASGCQLEILPKIEATGEDGTASPAALRKRLVHMLAVAHDLKIDAGAMAQLGWQRDTLLEILIRLFCRQLTDAVRQGMPRRYVHEEEDLSALRGRLDVTRQFSVLAAQPQRLACRFDALSSDIHLNQVMKAVIGKLARLAHAADNQRNLRELGFVYADITDVPPTALHWNSIVLDRTQDRWRALLSLARLLLGNRFQQTSAGASEGYALLFEMNVLFEAYVTRLVTRAVAGTDFCVSRQGGQAHCLFDGPTGRFRTRPDIIVRHGDKPVLVIDTKWKRIAARIDDPKQGVSQSDVYQLMAYARLYECDRVMLLYPHHHGMGQVACSHAYRIAGPTGPDQLHVVTLDVTAKVSVAIGTIRELLNETLSGSQLAHSL